MTMTTLMMILKLSPAGAPSRSEMSQPAISRLSMRRMASLRWKKRSMSLATFWLVAWLTSPYLHQWILTNGVQFSSGGLTQAILTPMEDGAGVRFAGMVWKSSPAALKVSSRLTKPLDMDLRPSTFQVLVNAKVDLPTVISATKLTTTPKVEPCWKSQMPKFIFTMATMSWATGKLPIAKRQSETVEIGGTCSSLM